MSKYKLHPKAEKDMEDIWHYTRRKWGLEQTIRYIDGLNAAFKNLADWPLICRERTEFNPPVRIYHHEKHLIVYLTEKSSITIIRVLHENMDSDTRLGE